MEISGLNISREKLKNHLENCEHLKVMDKKCSGSKFVVEKNLKISL